MAGPPFHVSHVFFDVDGTLVDFRASLAVGLYAAAEYLSERTDRIVTPQALQETRDRVARSFKGSLNEVRDQSFRQVLRERGRRAENGQETEGGQAAHDTSRGQGISGGKPSRERQACPAKPP